MKKLLYISACFVTAFFMLSAVTLRAQEVVLSDEFDDGDGLWTSGWIDGATTVTFSIDNTSKLSGENSYKAVITQGVAGGGEMWHIQRNANLPLFAGNQYTVSFMAVSDADDAALNVLLELAGDPYTKRIDDTASVTNTPQTFTYSTIVTEDVPTNQLKFMFAGARNTGKTIWIDNIVVTRIADPTLVSQWGQTTQGRYWPIRNDAGTTAGSATISGDGTPLNGTGWATLRGEFDTLEVTTGEAVVVSGKLELVGTIGGESSYTPLRYAITYHDNDTLNNALTDSAYWIRGPGYGYAFMPRSGAGTISNGAWGTGTMGVINNGSWNSSNSNGGPALVTVLQAPRLSQIIPGIYNWAMSVQQVNDTTNEIRWYLVEENDGYWFGGTVTGPASTDKINGVSFGINTGDWTEFNLSEVSARLGDPITVPEAPWEPYYIDQWGETTQGRYFVIQNDSDTFVGDGIIASADGTPINGAGQASIRGGFGQELLIKTDEAIIVSGELELVGTLGGESSYNPLRYGIMYNVDDTLMYALTDSAYWVRGPGYGYIFTPRTGAGTIANGVWGTGTVGVLNNGNFHSTNSNGGPALATILQAPRNAQMIAGTYDWAISVHQVNDSTNEIRWYLIEEDNQYWYGGIVTGPAVTDRLTGVSFNVNTGDWTEVRVLATEVDYGAPITIPLPPWEPYYVDQWGFFGDPSNRIGGWQLEPGQFVGNVSISGSAPVPANEWSAIRGGFETFTALQERPLKITGTAEFVGGGFEAWSSLRLGVFYSDSAGVLDSTDEYGYMWTGSENYNDGYLFMPHSGTNDVPTWSGPGGTGTWGGVVDAVWLSTNGASNYIIGSDLQEPSGAVAGAGTYDFELSVTPQGDGTNLVKFQLVKDDESYKWQVETIDNHSSVATEKFNSIAFAVGPGTATALNLTDVQIDTGTAVNVNELENNLIPTEYSLNQNYPNPFNPTTTIEFALPQTGNVSLAVYDILGRKVADLVKGNLNAGYHKINFDASQLSSGVYFYRIETGDFVNVKKLMLLK